MRHLVPVTRVVQCHTGCKARGTTGVHAGVQLQRKAVEQAPPCCDDRQGLLFCNTVDT
jgi:hypothetical protein